MANPWHDLSPLVRRMAGGAAIGGAGGAVGGAVLGDDEHRGRGALIGGTLGALGGAGVGAGYNALRPITPLAMPGVRNVRVAPRTRSYEKGDYSTVLPSRDTSVHSPQYREGAPPNMRDDPQAYTGVPNTDRAGRPIRVVPQVIDAPELGHLGFNPKTVMDDASLRKETGDLLRKAYDPAADTYSRPVSRSDFPQRDVSFDYNKPLAHDAAVSASENELRRLLRLQQRKTGGMANPWHDLSPLVRRMAGGAAIGGAGGAVGGAVLGDDEHRGRGALIGGTLGALGGAGAGAGYNALRPITPLAMPGPRTTSLYATAGGVHPQHDYAHLKPSTLPEGHAMHGGGPFNDDYRSGSPLEDYPEIFHGLPSRDFAGRELRVTARSIAPTDLSHLSYDVKALNNDPSLREELGTLLRKKIDPERAISGKGRSPYGTDVPIQELPKREVNFIYGKPLAHDRQISPEENELRRLLRLQQRKTASTMFLTGLEELLEKVAAFSAPSAWDKRMTMRKQMTQAGKPKVQAAAKKPPPSFAQPTKTYHIDPTSVYA